MGMVPTAPAEAASTSTDMASSCEAPSAIALLKALVAAASASTMVLSPSTAAPSFCTPASAASSAAHSPCRSTSAAFPRDFPARRKAVPYSGPAAPPTLEMMALPVRIRIFPGVRGAAARSSSASSASSAALKPRARLMP
jgi:hypothetical protein